MGMLLIALETSMVGEVIKMVSLVPVTLTQDLN